MTEKLKEARAAVNKEVFGSAEWEAAMEVVRSLVQAENDAAPRFEHTSIDGDIWN